MLLSPTCCSWRKKEIPDQNIRDFKVVFRYLFYDRYGLSLHMIALAERDKISSARNGRYIHGAVAHLIRNRNHYALAIDIIKSYRHLSSSAAVDADII